MEQALATAAIWLAVGMVGQKDGFSAVFVGIFAMVATGMVWTP